MPMPVESVLAFDIKTIPDIEGARRQYNLHGLSDEDVARAVFHKHRQQAGSEELSHHLHKIVAISAVLASGGQFRLWSLGNEDSNEQDLLQRFYAGIDRYLPRLVTWDGGGFSLPVIHYRSLLYPLNAARYWDTGQHDAAFRDNHYLARDHQRHTDLKAVLSGHQTQAACGLNEIAALCGFTTQPRLDINQLWQSWLDGDIARIRQVGEIDALNTYLLFLNWQRNRGNLGAEAYLQQCDHIRAQLKASEQPCLIEFERSWIEL